MSEGEIRVHVVKYPGRKNLVMRYLDPVTGKQVTKSAESARRKDAERSAAKWEAELREGRYQKPSRMTWQEFRERYTREKLAVLADKTLEAADAAFNHLEREIDPKQLESLNSEQLSRFQRKLSENGMKATTLSSHLRSIRAALNWAHRKGFMRKSPDIDMPKAARGIDRSMRGRPITTEEFERMLDTVPKVRKLEPAKWQRLLRGLWLSGLRLGEALQLSWDGDADITVRLDGKYPRLRLLAEGHKAHRDQLLPITPDFAEFLLSTPVAERHGLCLGSKGRLPANR
jgi:integrase